MHLTVLTKSFLRHWCQSVSAMTIAGVCQDKPPDNWWEAMDCGTWLQKPCLLHAVLTKRGGWLQVYHLHTDWRALGRWVHSGPTEPMCNDMWLWLTGRTFGMFGNQDVKICLSMGKTWSSGWLALKGTLWPFQCQRHWHLPGNYTG
jgi:hypothetical protein